MKSEELQQLVEANENLVLAVLQAHAQRAAAEKKIRDLACMVELDALTNLPNRLVLQDRLRHAIVNAKRGGDRLALLFIDLNKFKQINDTLGHLTGDEVLKTVARCLTASVRESDTVSRHGGDEFVVLLEKITELSDVTEVVKKILSSIGTPNQVGSHTIHLTASVGISLFPDDGDNAETLFLLADKAMYAAKRAGNGGFVSAGENNAEDSIATNAIPASPIRHLLEERGRRQEYRRSEDEQMAAATLAAHELQAEAELALRRQTEFMAMLAHELRNPLGPIRNAASIIGHVLPDSATAVKMQELINRQVSHMAKLLDDVFDMSRIATGKLHMDCKCIDFVKIIKEAIDSVQSSIDARQQRLQYTVPDFAVEIVGDAGRLVQVFANLLDNASKYSPEEGPITLTMEIGEASVGVKVTDTGIGITAEALPNVFQMFAQDSHASRFNGHGLGIGLAFVKDIIEAHCGVVTAHSEGIGLGSHFMVTLPTRSIFSDPSPER